jgi:hypothetical protein
MLSQPVGRLLSSRDQTIALGVAAIAVALALRGASSVEYFIRDWHFGSYGGAFTRIWIGEALDALGYLIQAGALLVISWALVANLSKRPRRMAGALLAIAVSLLVSASAVVLFAWIYVQHRYLHTAGTGELAAVLSALCLSAASAVAATAFARTRAERDGRAKRDLLLARAAVVAAIGFALGTISGALLAMAWGDSRATILSDTYIASLWITAGAAAVVTAGWAITTTGFSGSARPGRRDRRLAIASTVLGVGYLVFGIAATIRQGELDTGGWWSAAAAWVSAGHFFLVALGLGVVAFAFFRTRSTADLA